MSYPNRSKAQYGNRKRSLVKRNFGKSVAEVQNARSLKAKLLDASLKAPIAETPQEWIENPNRLDLPNVDMPKTDEDTKASVRQPWELKYQDFFDAAGSEYMAGERFGVHTHNRVPVFRTQIKGEIGYRWVSEEGATPEERIHRAIIRKAIMEGKTIPDIVLKQYPDMAKLLKEQKALDSTTRELRQFEFKISPQQEAETWKKAEKAQAESAAMMKAYSESSSGNYEEFVASHKIVENIGSVKGSVATYNKATGWMAISFDGIPSPEIRQELKANGFRWHRFRKQWVAKAYPFREDLAKKYAGSIQEVNIEPNWALKAEHAANLASKHEAKGDEMRDKADKIQDAIPFGQPILVGHHSEKKHRSDINKIGSLHIKAIEEDQIAEKFADRAARYGEKATGEAPGVIYRRIHKLEAEERKFQKLLDEADLADRIEKKNPALLQKYYLNRNREWPTQNLTRIRQRLEVERQKYQASGGIATDKNTFQVGDRVQTRFGAGTIATISKKTARIKLDPDPINGRVPRIYANSKDESLLTLDDIRGKIITS